MFDTSKRKNLRYLKCDSTSIFRLSCQIYCFLQILDTNITDRLKKREEAAFRELIEEISMLMGYEALRDLPTTEITVKTPITTTTTKVLADKKLTLVPILRAGLGMVNGLLALVPSAKVGHIGIYRDHETLEPKEYYCKLPEDISSRDVILLDPMLATGGSSVAAVNFLKEKNCKSIKLMCIIAAPEGIKMMCTHHPDVNIYCACVDQCLNDKGYIVPGLGDAGDRIFGTK